MGNALNARSHPDEILFEGVTLTKLCQISDSRGAVLHMLRSDDQEFTSFGECYFSELMMGAVKAWKCHRDQTQNLAVPVGRIRIVIYDERDGSASYGRVQVFELGRPDAYFRLRIPYGLWYGFSCLSETPALIVNCPDMPHDPSESILRPIDDPGIPYDWTS